jgi:hypothetical protein
MSDRGPGQPPSGLRLEYAMIGAVLLMALLAIAWVMSQRQQELRSSPSGLDGLQLFLTESDIRTQSYFGGWPLNQDDIGLLVVPLYDSQLDSSLRPPVTAEDMLLQPDEYDLGLAPVLAKAEALPLLVILPKWRSGLRLTGLGHPVLLADGDDVAGGLQRITGQNGLRIQRSRVPFVDLPYQGQDKAMSARLYVAQTFAGAGCDAIVGTPGQMVLADCPVAGPGHRVLILSDPDLLNNHGLRLGQNAAIARDFLAKRAGGKNIVIDYSPDNWLAEQEAAPLRERTWADLARFFEPPFAAIWLGAGLTLALFLWRASRRFGPVVRVAHGQGAAKMQAIAARARLMRLTDQHGALVGEYAHARIAATAARLVGPGHARLIGEEQAFLRYVARHHAAKVARLDAVLTRLRQLPKRITAAEAIHHIDELEQVLEQITHDT